MKTYKMLVFDVDGTLYDLIHHSIPASCIEAIQKAKANGYLFVIATGRAHYGLGKALTALQPDYILAVNGGVVADRHQQIISQHTMDEGAVRDLIGFANKTQAGLVLKFIDHMYIYQYPEKIDWLEGQRNSDIGPEAFCYHPEQSHHFIASPIAACIHAPQELVEAYAAKQDHLAFYRYSEDGYDVVNKGLDKSVGLCDLITYLSMRKDDVVCIGDNYNDIPMMQTAGYCIAMGNAVEEVKQLADFVTTSTDKDGIYNALKHLKCF